MPVARLQSGMTLVEMAISISIFLVVFVAVTSTILYLYQVNGYTIAQSYEIDNARRGLQEWLGDTREMTFADDGTFPIAVMEPHRIAFYSDVDRDNSVEFIEYRLASTTLYKRTYSATGTPPVYSFVTPESSSILSEYVQNIVQGTSTFYYFDEVGAPVTSTSSLLTDVRYIETRIIVNIDPVRDPSEFLLRSGVTLRNLKDNL